MHYADFSPEDVRLTVTNLAAEGATDAQIAGCLGIHPNTFWKWKNADKDGIAEALREGRTRAIGRVENALFKRATGYVAEDSRQVTLERTTRGGVQYTEKRTTVSQREVPPHLPSIMAYLNRHGRELYDIPDEFGERAEAEDVENEAEDSPFSPFDGLVGGKDTSDVAAEETTDRRSDESAVLDGLAGTGRAAAILRDAEYAPQDDANCPRQEAESSPFSPFGDAGQTSDDPANDTPDKTVGQSSEKNGRAGDEPLAAAVNRRDGLFIPLPLRVQVSGGERNEARTCPGPVGKNLTRTQVPNTSAGRGVAASKASPVDELVVRYAHSSDSAAAKFPLSRPLGTRP